MMIKVRYYAGARAAAGVLEDEVTESGCTLPQLTATLTARRGPRLAAVLGAASFLVDGVIWRDRDRPLPEAAVIDVLPPFAGG